LSMEKTYGWEDDIETIWLWYINKLVLANGIITQDEYLKIEAEITKRKVQKENEDIYCGI